MREVLLQEPELNREEALNSVRQAVKRVGRGEVNQSVLITLDYNRFYAAFPDGRGSLEVGNSVLEVLGRELGIDWDKGTELSSPPDHTVWKYIPRKPGIEILKVMGGPLWDELGVYEKLEIIIQRRSALQRGITGMARALDRFEEWVGEIPSSSEPPSKW